MGVEEFTLHVIELVVESIIVGDSFRELMTSSCAEELKNWSYVGLHKTRPARSCMVHGLHLL